MIKTETTAGLGAEVLARNARLAERDDTSDRLARVFADHVDFVWRVARRSGLSDAEADDCTQQVFLVLSRKLANVPPGEERRFLFGTTMNVARTTFRTIRRKREEFAVPVEILDGTPNPEEALANAEAMETIHAIFAAMPEDIRSAFVLFEVEELTMLEVSRLLDIPLGTVASRIRRGRELFRAALVARGSNDG